VGQDFGAGVLVHSLQTSTALESLQLRLFKPCMARVIGTKAPLSSAGVWTDQMLAGREDFLVGLMFSDQNGTLLVEQGIDGQNWDFDTTVNLVGGTGKEFKIEIYAAYIKLTYTTGATPQNEFRLGARFSSAGNR
jgi:hypothetical protein